MPRTKSAERTHRVQILLPPKSMDRLDRLVEQTEASSYAEVLRNALRLYEAVIDGMEQGGKVYMERDGERVALMVLSAETSGG